MEQELKVGERVFAMVWNGVEASATISSNAPEGSHATLSIGPVGGPALWSSPAVESSEAPLAFGVFFDGEALPEWFGDLDGDGQGELLAPMAKSDISPTVFRIFRWDGATLSPVRAQALLETSEGLYTWSELPEFGDGLRWIDGFDGHKARLFTYREGELTKTTASVEAVAEGFKRRS